jgi:hypothetical protein
MIFSVVLCAALGLGGNSENDITTETQEDPQSCTEKIVVLY